MRFHFDNSRSLIPKSKIFIGLCFLLVVSFIHLVSIHEDPNVKEIASLRQLIKENSAADQNRGTLGICITGQVSRLELQSKIHNLFRPAADAYNLWVVFVLDAEKSHFANPQWGQPAPLFNATTWEAEVATQMDTVHNTKMTAVNFVQPVKPYIQEDYQARTPQKAVYHARQWAASAECWARMQQIQVEANISFSGFMRIREDLYVVKSFVPQIPQGRSIVTSSCEAWGYMNDKGAIVAPEAAEDYFTGAQWVHRNNYSGFPNFIHRKYAEPEAFMQYVMVGRGINIVRNVSLFPLITYRLPGGNRENLNPCLKVMCLRCYASGLGGVRSEAEWLYFFLENKCNNKEHLFKVFNDCPLSSALTSQKNNSLLFVTDSSMLAHMSTESRNNRNNKSVELELS